MNIIENTPEQREQIAKETLTDIANRANEIQADIASIYFDGSGDSGDVTSVDLLSSQNIVFVECPDLLERDLVTFFDNYLQHHIEWDWVNNEGGRGVVRINFKTREIEISGFYRVEEEVEGCSFTL
jgi:hypothetical protein